MSENKALRYLISGKIEREYIVTGQGQTHLDFMGGNALYAAAGLAVWDEGIGVISRIGEDFPQEWLEELKENEIDQRGVVIIPENLDLRKFYAYDKAHNRVEENPVSQFAKLGIHIPKSLLGYKPSLPSIDNRNLVGPQTIRINDIPSEYLDAIAAHISPSDFLSHSILPPLLRQGNVSTISLNPGQGYMDPVFWEDIPAIVNRLTTFISTEKKLRSLFQGRSSDLWEMAEAVSAYGCEIIIIQRQAKGVLVYDNATRAKWIIPAYPIGTLDPTGSEDAFCGGFLAGFQLTYDPVEAALQGSISYSLSVEGSGPFYPLGALPGIANARLHALRNTVQKK